jgi:CDP-paratose 2-epimerase
LTPRRILVTGGAGFVGSALALRARATWPEATVTAFDNLRRRGSELNLARLRDAGVAFVHGDIWRPSVAISTCCSSARPSPRCWPATTATRAT